MPTTERNPALDVAKGLAMLCVVLGHIIDGPVGGLVAGALYAFHMPAFFLLSGICFAEERHNDLARFATIRARQLLWPTLLFAALYALSYVPSGRVAEFFLGQEACVTLGPLWFPPILYVVCVAYAALRKAVGHNPLCLMAIAALSLVAGLVTSALWGQVFLDLTAAFAALFFYALGHLIRPAILRFDAGRHGPALALFCAAALALFLVAFIQNKPPHTLFMHSNCISSIDVLPALAGCAVVMALAYLTVDYGGGGGSARRSSSWGATRC